MKRWKLVVGIMAFAATATATATATVVPANNRVAYVNLNGVVEQLPQHQEMVRQLQTELSARASELQMMEQSITEKLKNLQRDTSVMQRSEREICEKEVADLRQQFVAKAQKFEQQTRQKQLEVQDELLKQIRQATQAIAKKQGYTMVLDASAVIYAGSAKDITIEVAGALKK